MPEYGYKEGERQGRNRSSSRSPNDQRGHKKRGKAEKKMKKEPADRGDRGDRGDDARPDKREKKRSRQEVSEKNADDPPPQAAPDNGRKGMNSWREELEKTDRAADDDDDDDGPPEGVVAMETDEDVEKKLAESRARREALMAKWVNRGEEGGGLQFAETNTSLHDEEGGSDGEVDAFFAAKQAELKKSDKVDEKEIEEKRAVNRYILQQRQERDGDMFDEDTDNQDALNKSVSQADAIGQTGASGDDWNDAEGYYRAKIGEVMDGRYRVTEDNCGKGTFSGVIKATDQETKTQVAIKIMRCNDMMKKAAEKEIEILERLRDSDKDGKRNVIRLHRTFMYRGHLCLVFECMWDNLRVALKKYTKDKGMSLRAVRAYTRQLLIALQHIHRLQYIHADIKPDNILISSGHNLVKICDLGSAMELTEVEVTPYLVSRFYRAPEIVLGMKYGQAADTFSLGASLCELFTGKILFPGKSNNDMLRLFMELKGKFPHKMIKSGTTWQRHFNENLDFKYVASDPVTRKRKTRVISDLTAKKSVKETILQRVGAEKQKSEDSEDKMYIKKAKQFGELIDQMVALDPEKRATPTELLKHPFLAENWPAPKENKKS